jgi:prevent-host-death family protein
MVGALVTTVVTMNEFQIREVKARLSAVIDMAERGEPSVITRRGRKSAVLLSYSEWQKLSRVPSFGRLLMAAPIEAADLPRRARKGLRSVGP